MSLGQGLLWWENPIDGVYVQHQFGPKVSAMVGVGDISAAGWNEFNTNTQFANIAIQTSPATKITLANMRTLTNTQRTNNLGAVVDSDYKLNQFAIGLNTQITPKWNLIAEAVTNNVGSAGSYWDSAAGKDAKEELDKHGLWTRVTYGKQEWNKANTWQVYGEYFALGNASVDSKYWGHRLNIAGGNSSWDGDWYDSWGNGVRGYGIGVGYMLAANTNLELTWYKLKPYREGNGNNFSNYDNVAYAALTYSF